MMSEKGSIVYKKILIIIRMSFLYLLGFWLISVIWLIQHKT